MKRNVRAGEVFGRLITVRMVGKDKTNHALWECTCSCGAIKIANSRELRSGDTKSCGCWQKELVAKLTYSHGHMVGGKASPTHKSWSDMLQRCTNPKRQDYKYYGGAGIKVCERWKNFNDFLEDMGVKPTKHHTLGRFGDVGDYQPSNCAWQTRTEQGLEKRKKNQRRTN